MPAKPHRTVAARPLARRLKLPPPAIPLALAVTLSLVACAPPGEDPAASAAPEAAVAAGLPIDEATTEIVDLTHAFDADTIYWPTESEGFVLEDSFVGQTDKGFYYAAHRFRAPEHGGTHLDAPVHFAEGAWTADEIPVGRLIGPGVVVDVSAAAAADADYQVSVADLEAWESENGPLPGGAIVLLRTGFGDRWPDRAGYLGTEKTGPDAVAELHFPGLAPAAAEWLVAERSIDAIGLDTPSIDFGQSELFESHRALFAANVPAFENVARLGELPPTGFTVVALPMKIGGGSGGPLRIVALLPRTAR